jgi:serine/threonine-protein kinase
VVPFDVNTLETHGTPVPLLSGVFTSNSNGFSVSRNGILAVRLGGSGSGASTIQLIDNHSVLKPLLAAGTYMRPRFSPDGKSLALDLDSSFVGVYDLDRETLRRLTRAGVTRGPQPVWTPDGRFLIFGGDGELSWIRSDGASAPQRLIQSKNIVWPQSVSPDGKFLLYLELTDDLHGMIAPLEISTEGLRAGKSERVLQAAGADRQFMFSPDGKWIAFASNQSGTYQVYVRAFPDRGAQWQVSNQGGVYPMWSRTANEMLYRSEDSRTLMAVSYTVKGDAFVPDKPYLWASTQMVDTPLTANFDLAPDGKHVAGVFPVTGGENAEPLMLLVNFFDEVTRRAPLGK